MHLKRSNIPKFWQVPRKGTKYMAVPSHNQAESIPMVIVVRDILGLAKNKKEVERMIKEKLVQINHKEIKETNYPLSLFDVLTFPHSKKNYRAILSEKRKMIFEEISDKEAETKIFKVLNKHLLPGKDVQVNLMHGINVNSKEKVSVGESVVLNLKEKKIIKVIPLEKGREAFIVEGKHAGNKGKIDDLVVRGGKNIAKITSGKGKVNVWTKNIIVIN